MKIKTFASSSGLEIWVGQDDASNDALSLDIAHANDVWLHVSGHPGSHVLIRSGESGAKVDRTTLKEAAGLAAYFSKMRQGGKVLVHYCLAKDVSKPRGAPQGQVRIRREQKITTRPALLPEIETS